MTDFPRYQRQTLLKQIGEAGQRRLGRSVALVVGCGALGSVAAELLARAGVGRLRLVDRDFVEETNLHRQSLYDQADAEQGLPKAEAARARLAAINPNVTIQAQVVDFNPSNARTLAEGAQVIVDGTDNFETRFLINDVAVEQGIPWVYGGSVGTEGMQMSLLPRTAAGDSPWERAGCHSPCLRCLFDRPPPPGSQPTCDTAGVLGPVAWMVAAAEAMEAIKILVGDWPAVDCRLRRWAGWRGQFHAMETTDSTRTDCPCCAQRRFDYLEQAVGSQTTAICGRMAVQVLPQGAVRDGESVCVDFDKLADTLRRHGRVTVTPFTLRAELSHSGDRLRLTLFADGRAILQGTRDPATARAVYSQYIGL